VPQVVERPQCLYVLPHFGGDHDVRHMTTILLGGMTGTT
jgi:hypothetical protein